jgi:hypothetical protein
MPVHVPSFISNSARMGIDPLTELISQRTGDQHDQLQLVSEPLGHQALPPV